MQLIARKFVGRPSRCCRGLEDDFDELSLKAAYPHNADKETRTFVRYWFDDYTRRQLAALAAAIRRVRDDAIRDALWCAFSRLIITKQAGVSLARDLAHSRPHRVFERSPIKPFGKFLFAVDRVLENCIPAMSKGRGPAPSMYNGDARKLPIADNSIDLVLTSPPYLNAIDYMRCSKFSLIWMGRTTENLRKLRSHSVGSEVGEYEPGEFSTHLLKQLRLRKRLSSHHEAMLNRFIEDMRAAVFEVSRVLIPGGKAIYILGDNTVRGTYIPNSRIITAIASRAGLTLQRRRTRTLPSNRRYLPPPGRGKCKPLDTRLCREVILSFRKPKIRQRGKRR